MGSTNIYKVGGGKMYDELKKGIKKNKLDRDTWNSIERETEDKWEKRLIIMVMIIRSWREKEKLN